MSNTSKLMATFTSRDRMVQMCNKIRQTFRLSNNKIFVFKRVENPDSIILTYNIVPDSNSKLERTISINRNQEHNCLFTIDALNVIITKECGKQNKNYVVDWSKYANSLLFKNKNGDLEVVPIELETKMIV